MDAIKVTPAKEKTSLRKKKKEEKKRTLCLRCPWRGRTAAKNNDSLKRRDAPNLLITSMQKDKKMERRTAISSTRFFVMNALLCITPDSIPSPHIVDTNLLQQS